jgi:hypothetical protein
LEHKFTDTVTLVGTRVTTDGYLVGEVRCARSGCQQYLASELGLVDSEPGEVVNVYRPESAVFSKDSMATFVGKPVTVGHPPEMVDSSNWKKYAVGDIGEEVARDGEFIRVPITLMDAAAVRSVQAGLREISMGYTTPLSMEDGVAPDGTRYRAVQTGPIRINHLALVDRARGGEELRIGDGAEKWGTAPATTRAGKDSVMTEQLRTILVDGLSVQTTDQGAQAIEKLQKSLDSSRQDLDRVTGAKDAEIADLQKQIEKKDGELAAASKALEDARSAKSISEAVRARALVVDAGKKSGMKEEDMEDMSDADIRRAVVTKSLGDSAAKMSDAAVEGAFAFAVRTMGDQKRLSTGITSVVDGAPNPSNAYQESINHMSDAWKQSKEAH